MFMKNVKKFYNKNTASVPVYAEVMVPFENTESAVNQQENVLFAYTHMYLSLYSCNIYNVSVTDVYMITGLNKYKKRRFQNTVNLLTGETDVHPDLILVTNLKS